MKIGAQFFTIREFCKTTDDFAESLITAEWLRDSMRKAHAIDLTVIGTGYFKAAEQLLFSLAKLRFSNVDEKETFGNFAHRYQKNQKLLFHIGKQP